MLEWLFGSSSEQVDPYSEKVEEAMQEVRVVKDFYNRCSFLSCIMNLECSICAHQNAMRQASTRMINWVETTVWTAAL